MAGEGSIVIPQDAADRRYAMREVKAAAPSGQLP